MLGAGLWGTVLANHLAGKGVAVWLWEFFPQLARDLEAKRRHPHIPQLELSPKIRVSSDIGASARDAFVLVVALPSAHVRPAARALRGLLARAAPKPVLVSASKGVEPASLLTIGEVLEEELPFLKGSIYALSGPSLAREVARGVATKLVLAGRLNAAAKRLRELFDGGELRVELSSDRKGVELGGSLKNVVAIGCGLLDGLKAGANTKAALLIQGIAEMDRLIRSEGGKPDTVYGLSGLGDLVATGTSPESRNRALGEKLGAGIPFQEAMRQIATVKEGVESARSAHEIIRSKKISAPLMESVWKIVHRGAPPRLILEALGFQR